MKGGETFWRSEGVIKLGPDADGESKEHRAESMGHRGKDKAHRGRSIAHRAEGEGQRA